MIVIGPKAHWSFQTEKNLSYRRRMRWLFRNFAFPKKETSRITYGQLQKAGDDSPFPALTQIEVLVGIAKFIFEERVWHLNVCVRLSHSFCES